MTASTPLIAAGAEGEATAPAGQADLLGDLEAQLRALAAVSEDSYQFVVSQALDVATALRHVHEGRAAA